MTEFELKISNTPKGTTFADLDQGEAFLSEAKVVGVKRGWDWADYFPDGEFGHSVLRTATGINPQMSVKRVKSIKMTVVLA